MPAIPAQTIDEVRFASDLVAVVSDYVTLKKAGRNFLGLCPFHSEKTPSFNVNADKQFYHCFGCSAGGNVFTFIQKIEGVGFPEAVRLLAKRAGIAIPEPEREDHALTQEKEALFYANQMAAEFFQHALASPVGKIAWEYLQRRGFEEAAILAFGLGFAPGEWEALVNHARSKAANLELLASAGLVNAREKDGQAAGHYDRFRNRVMFPIHNLSGRVVAFGGRRIIDDDSPKYINSPETAIYQKGHVLYGFTQARDTLRAYDRVIVVEGYLDVMRMHVCGFTNTVATSGTALTEHQARLILRYTKNVTLLFDSDAAGAKATIRGADILVENGLQVRVATLEAGDDPDSFLRQRPAEDLRRILEEAPTLFDFKILQSAAAKTSAAPSDRTEQLRSIIETLARVNDGLERQALVHRMAESLRVDESVMWEEISRLRRTRASSRIRRAETPSQPNLAMLSGMQAQSAERFRRVEMELLRIMILHWEAIRFIFSFMRMEDFHNPEAAAMAGVFHDLLVREIPLEPEDLLHYFHEPAQAEFVSTVIHQERKYTLERDYRRWSADCMAQLQRLMIEENLQALRNQIKESETSGQEVTELLQQFDEHQKQLGKVRADNFLLAS